MTSEEKVNVYCTILAYTQGSWTPEQVAEGYEFIVSKTKKANMSLVSTSVDKEQEEMH